MAISTLLARWLSVENAERDAVYGLLGDQARGASAAMLRRLSGCPARPGCAATVDADARSLARPGSVRILADASSTAYSLTGASGVTRVAWSVPGRLPVVQCVLVRRNGDAISGFSVTLLALSAPIDNTGAC